MVRSIFIEEDADIVIKLSVPQHDEDELIWVLELSGYFSIETSYHVKNIYYFNENNGKFWH